LCGFNGFNGRKRPAAATGADRPHPAVPAGFLTLNDVAGRLETLEVACNRCDRRGLHTDRPELTGETLAAVQAALPPGLKPADRIPADLPDGVEIWFAE
jgi:hypothetical protein